MPGAAGVGEPGCPPIELVQAYLDTDYRIVGDDGDVVLRIGERAPLPAPEPGRVHAVLSAGNPRSRPQTAAQNARADAALRARADGLGLAWRPALGVGRTGHWPPEASLWIQDIAGDRLDALALEWDQNACLVVTADRRARLRLYRPDWRDQLPAHADLDWP
jgi:hypothetical protein